MHHYDLGDFLRYYSHAWIVHPVSSQIVQVLGHSEDGRKVLLSDKSSVSLKDLDWKHCKSPRLGYRHLENGAALYYITRRPSRLTEKGVTPSAIVIDVPPVINTLSSILGQNSKILQQARLDVVAQQLFNPNFVPLKTAVELLQQDKNSIGFALSHNWAVTLGTHKADPFYLHFMDMRVATSQDGAKWKFNSTDSEALFNGGLD